VRDKALASIERFNMLNAGDFVVIGLSGGADSIALAHFLKSIQAKLSLKLLAVHVEHGLRGAEALRDADFCKSFCAAQDIELKVFHRNIKAEAELFRTGTEETGRRIRYELFAKCAGDQGKIATAHTLSDCAETLLLNMARGCALGGLLGIPPVRGNIIRPLIACTRNEVEAYINRHDLDFVSDSTNLIEDYARNRLRLKAVPALCSVNSAFHAHVAELIHSLGQDNEYLSSEAEKALNQAKTEKGGLAVSTLKALHPAILSRALHSFCREYSPEAVHLLLITEKLELGSGAVTLPKGGRVHIKNGVLSLDIQPAKPPEVEEWSVPFKLGEIPLPNGKILNVEKSQGKVYNLLAQNCINCDKITSMALIRNRRAGDTFAPAGRCCTKPLKKLFNELKIPPFERENLAILEAEGEILWIEGIGASQNGKAITGQELLLIKIME
jgi:tRNA(Ile)-lysidine synthase